MTTCSSSATGAASREVSLLLSCLHMGAAVSAPPADVHRAFGLLRTLLSNRCEHPTEPRYASFSATSTAWVRHVIPIVYVLRLAAWMGCALNGEGTRYIFRDSATPDGACLEDANGCAAAVLADRLHELHYVASTWSDVTPSAPTGDDATGNAPDGAKQALLELFGGVTASAARDEEWATHTRRLLLRRLLCSAHATSDASAGHALGPPPPPPPPSAAACGGANSWVAHAHAEAHRYASQTEADAFEACVTRHAVRQLLSQAPLRDVELLCESVPLAAAAAAVPAACKLSRASVVPSFSASVADRLRQRAQQEQQQHYLATTGPAYRRLCHEERHRGESVIVDIAGLVEQLALVTETQGMVRQDRQEARRLLDAFRQDGDLAKLYALEERYTAELEAAKQLYGKPLVYEQPPDV